MRSRGGGGGGSRAFPPGSFAVDEYSGGLGVPYAPPLGHEPYSHPLYHAEHAHQQALAQQLYAQQQAVHHQFRREQYRQQQMRLQVAAPPLATQAASQLPPWSAFESGLAGALPAGAPSIGSAARSALPPAVLSPSPPGAGLAQQGRAAAGEVAQPAAGDPKPTEPAAAPCSTAAAEAAGPDQSRIFSDDAAAAVPDLLRASGAFSQSSRSPEPEPRRVSIKPFDLRLIGLVDEEDDEPLAVPSLPATAAPPLPFSAKESPKAPPAVAAAPPPPGRAAPRGPPTPAESGASFRPPSGTIEAEAMKESFRSESLPVSLISRRPADLVADDGGVIPGGALHPDFRDDCSSLSSLDDSSVGRRAAAGTPIAFTAGLAGSARAPRGASAPAAPPSAAALSQRPPLPFPMPQLAPPASLPAPDFGAPFVLGRASAAAPSRHALGRAQSSTRPCRQWLDSGCTYCPYGDLCRFQHLPASAEAHARPSAAEGGAYSAPPASRSAAAGGFPQHLQQPMQPHPAYAHHLAQQSDSLLFGGYGAGYREAPADVSAGAMHPSHAYASALPPHAPPYDRDYAAYDDALLFEQQQRHLELQQRQLYEQQLHLQQQWAERNRLGRSRAFASEPLHRGGGPESYAVSDHSMAMLGQSLQQLHHGDRAAEPSHAAPPPRNGPMGMPPYF